MLVSSVYHEAHMNIGKLLKPAQAMHLPLVCDTII